MVRKIKQAGVSLIELMIAVALGLFLMSGVTYLYVSSKASYSTQASVASVQEMLRFGFEFLAFDLRMAGYMGCANLREMVPQVVANPPVPTVGLGGSLIGYDNGAGWTNPTSPAISRVGGTDVVVMSRASLSSIHLSENSNGSEFHITANTYGFQDNQILMVTDCRRSDVFRAGLSTGAGKINVAHASNRNSQPAGSTCPSGSGKLVTECGVAGNYKNDAMLAALESWTYFVGINARGNPALFRVGISGTAEELVEGVYDMQLEYGLDTVEDSAFLADSYYAASSINAPSTSPHWGQVVSAKLTLRARSPDENTVPDSQTYSYNGANVTDRRYRQTFTTVIGLRNLVQ